MNPLLIFFVAVLIVGGVGFVFRNGSRETFTNLSVTSPLKLINSQETEAEPSASDVKVLAQNLDTPWSIAMLPEGDLLVTERAGLVRLITKERQLVSKPVAQIESVKEIGEGGLLGITVHPQFASNNMVYLYYTYSVSGENTLNRVVQMVYGNDRLTDEKIILDGIPGASNHNGGRLKFGSDGFLYIGTGDAQEPSRAQDKNSLAGKILRITDSGQPAPGNPFGNAVYSYGHRNVQGLAWVDGQLYATEHARSGVRSGLDELNRVDIGKNYGWPTIEGDETQSGMETPLIHSGSTTWAPSGLAYLMGSFYFAGLRGQALYEIPLNKGQVKEVKVHLEKKYGRLRDVIVGADNMLYVTTSNKDGRGDPDKTDDRVLRINPAKL